MYTATDVKSAIPARIDRLPLSREMWRIMLLAGIAWLIESYDVGIMGNVLPLLEKQYHIDSLTTALLPVASTLGIVAMVVPAGWLADHFGRKRVLIIGTLWYSIFSLLGGFAPTMGILIALRFIAGFGMGTVFPVPYAMAAELTSKHFRGAMTAILDSFLSFGYFLAPLLALLITPRLGSDLGWRTLLWIGGLPLLYIPVLMKWMPESPRWLQTKGRTSEADRIVSDLESVIERRTGTPLPQPIMDASTPPIETKASRRQIFQRSYLKRTLMMWVAFSCVLFVFYAIQTYTPTVLVKEGYAIDNAFLITSIIVLVSVPGKYFAAYTVERFGRKSTLIYFSVIAAISATIFGFAHNAALALTFGCIMSFFGIGATPVIKIYGAEQYPTSIRETGVSFFECIGRFLGGALAPFIMAFMVTSGGIPGAYIFVAVLAVIGILVVAIFGNETRGEVLEKVSEAS